MTGSLSDHQRLISTLSRYELADRTADLLKTQDGYANSQAHYLPLISAARACGFSTGGSETAYAFAKRRAATFARELPIHAAETPEAP